MPSILFRNIAGILNTLIRPKLLNPQGFGLWSLLNTIPSYAGHLHLGSRTYMRFDIPRLLAAGDEDAVKKVESSVFWGSLAPNVGAATALLILAATGRFATEIWVGLIAMAAIVVLNCLYANRITVLKGRQMYRQLSRVMYLRNTSQLILSISLMLWLGIYGLFIALPITQIIALLYLHRRHPRKITVGFSKKIYFDMVRQGLPLTIYGLLMTLMITSGRFLVAGYLSTEEVGYYALASLIHRGMIQFPGAAREVLEPRIMENSGSLHEKAVLNRYLYRPLVINACYLPLIIGPIYFLLSPLIGSLLPLYTESIIPLQIILFGFFFLAVSFPLRSILIAQGLQKFIALITFVTLLVNVGLSLLALAAGTGIIGVSIANGIGYAVLLFLMAALLRLKGGILFPLSKLWPVLTSVPLLCLGIWASRMLIEPQLGTGWLGAMAQSALLFGTGLALLTVAEHKMTLLKGLSPLSILRTILRKITKS